MDYKSILTNAGDETLFSSIQTNLSEAISSDTTEWRRSFGRPIKVVRLKVAFRQFANNNLTNEKGLSLINQPILHMYWTECSDLDVYKLTVKDDIDSWLKVLQQNNINDWMIILVETYDLKKANKLIPRTTVLDKLRSDFASKHGDRCISVINPIKSESRSADSWRGLILRIRHLMLTAYDKLLIRFEEIIRDQRERRNQTNWNFCRYFILQEELAFSLESLGVYDEALVQYDELDALFTQFILNSDVGETPPWLNTFQCPINNWNGIDLTDNNNDCLRKLIAECKASLLDLRSYLFGRQCAMLLLLNKRWEIAQRCLPFIYNTLSEFRILEIPKPKGSIECWALLCAIKVLDICQLEFCNTDNSQQQYLCSLHTADLWALACDKLGELGVICGLMPENKPTSEQLHTVVYLIAGMGDSNMEIDNKITPIDKLKSALSSKEVFVKQYLEYAELAMGTYKHIGRIRSARYIGKKLAKFYSHIDENQTAVTFLLDSLKTYTDEGWQQLAVQTQLELADCYKKMNDVEKYVKICSSIASLELLDLTTRNTCFQEILKYIKDLQASPPLLIELEESFSIINIEVKLIDTIINDCLVDISINLKSLLPNRVENAKIIIFMEEFPEKDKRKGGKIWSESQVQPIYKWSGTDAASPNLQSNCISVHSYLDYKEDKTLDSAGIINKKSQKVMARSSSLKYKRNITDTKDHTTEKITSTNNFLKTGLNKFTLTSRVKKPDFYKINQLSLIIFDKLEYRSTLIQPQVYYEVTNTRPVISINSRDLLAGLMQDAELVVSNGSIEIPENTTVKIWASRGLKFKFAGSDNAFTSELEITLSVCEPFEIKTKKLILFAELPPKKDTSSIEYKLNIQSPWGTEKNITLHFGPPLISCLDLHTAKERKFLQIVVTGLAKNKLQLINPQLITNTSADVNLKSLNTISSRKLTIGHGTKISYVWEMELGQNYKSLSPVKIDFHIKYFPIQSDENSGEHINNDDPLEINKLTEMEKSSYTYQCNFEVSDYVTIFTVSSKVETSGSGGEFCRAGSMCHLCVTVMRMISSTNLNPSPQLMYEVLADQSMWAVCGRTAGIFTLEAFDKQSVTLDVMPLTSGYLPLPIVRLSRYIPAIESKNDTYRNNDTTGPRLEPFSSGQIYNASKSHQLYVLPAALTDFN